MDADGTPAGGDEAIQGESRDATSQQDATSPAAQSEEAVRLARELTPKQRIVLQALAEGCSPPEAARRAKVDPSTVNRWLNHNARFIAAHNAWITDTIKAGRAAVIALIPLAAQAVREEIESGNGWLALQVLRDAKLTTPPDASAITPKAARQQIKVQKQQRDADLAQKEVQIKLQQQEIEKLQQRVKAYENDKKLKKIEREEWYNELCQVYTAHKDEKRWQEQHAQHRKEEFERELNQINQQRESTRETQAVEAETGQPQTGQKVVDDPWKRRLEQQHSDEKADEQLLNAIKANPDGIAATGVQLPPGVQWPKNWPGAEKASTDPDASVRAASSVVESAAGPSDHPETSG